MKTTQIEYLRKKEKMSQEQLADKLGISRQTVSDWERGATYPSVEKLIELSDLFEVSLDYLIKGTTKENEEEPAPFLHFAKDKNTKEYVFGKQDGLIASIPEGTYVGNTLVIGGTGSGKTNGYLLPNIRKAIERQEAILVVDHNGEIQEVLKEELVEAGYKANNFNFMNPENSTKISLPHEVTINGNVSNKYLEVLHRSIYPCAKIDLTYYPSMKYLIKENTLFNFKPLDTTVSMFGEENKENSKMYFETFSKIKTLMNCYFEDENIKDMFSCKEIELKDLLNPKTITFITPYFFDENNTKLFVMLLNLLFVKIIMKDIKVENKFNVFLDEYGSYSRYFNLIDNISYLNKNITISILIQGLSQLDCNIDNAINNFRNFLYMGGFNMRDIRVLSDFFDVPEEKLRDINKKSAFKKEYNKTVFLDKLFI